SYPLLGPWITQRFQRFALRLMLSTDPNESRNQAGCVATVRSGFLARHLLLIPPIDSLEEPVLVEGPVVLAEVSPGQLTGGTSSTGEVQPVQVAVIVNAINFAPNEAIVFTFIP